MTHVLSKSSIGEKYNYATTFSIPVLTEDWLLTAWDNRENLGYRANVKVEIWLKVECFLNCFFSALRTKTNQ